MSKRNNSHQPVAVTFKGRNYMCIEGSPRAERLRRANRAWTMGYDELASVEFQCALDAPGCAFEAREAAQVEPREDRDGYWSDTAAYYNLYN